MTLHEMHECRHTVPQTLGQSGAHFMQSSRDKYQALFIADINYVQQSAWQPDI